MAVDAGVLMGQLVERMVEVQGAVEDFMAGLEALVGGEKVAAELEALVQQTVGAYNAVDKMDVDMAKSNGADTTTTSNGDFKPPEPFGGHPKRPRRMMLPQYDDPIEFLLEPRNPRLEALDLATAVNWEGAGSDDDDSDDDESSIHVPLILQSSIAGQSVATLLAPNPSSRPLPFESHANYQRRYDSEMASVITSTAELTKPGAGSDALERYKAARQRKREQMAKDKQSRVTEVMSALSLTGTGRRITSSLMGPGGAERTGRPSRHAVGSSSVHDAEYVEQLEIGEFLFLFMRWALLAGFVAHSD